MPTHLQLQGAYTKRIPDYTPLTFEERYAYYAQIDRLLSDTGNLDSQLESTTPRLSATFRYLLYGGRKLDYPA